MLDKLVNGALLYDASVKDGIKVDPAAVDAEFNAYKARFPGDKEFHDALAQLSFDEAGIKEKIGQSLAIEQFINEKFVGKAAVSDQEVKDYYDNNISAFASPEQVRASHILITVKPEADEATKKEARKKLERIRKQQAKVDILVLPAKVTDQGITVEDSQSMKVWRRHVNSMGDPQMGVGLWTSRSKSHDLQSSGA